MPSKLQDTVDLNNGVKMPWLGLGVWKAKEGQQVVDAVKSAISLGYRSIDTAAIYNNEEGVGKGISEALTENGLQREDIFITSKVWNSEQGYETTLRAYEESLRRLKLQYLDLYLIHWPVEGKFKETWSAMERLYRDGKVRAIGVSNFNIHHLEDLLSVSEIVPSVNQVEFHPQLFLKELLQFNKDKGIQLEAWSPLGRGYLLDHAVLKAIAQKYDKTTAQVILRWDLQMGVVTIPKSVTPSRIAQNADIFNFELNADDLLKIERLHENKRFGADPDHFDF